MSTQPTWKPRQLPSDMQRRRDFDHRLFGFVLALVIVSVACALFVQSIRGAVS